MEKIIFFIIHLKKLNLNIFYIYKYMQYIFKWNFPQTIVDLDDYGL